MAENEGMQNHKHRHLKKRNELLIHAAAWMNLRTRQEATDSVIPLWNVLETQSYWAGNRINLPAVGEWGRLTTDEEHMREENVL